MESSWVQVKLGAMNEERDLEGADPEVAQAIADMVRDPEGFWRPAPGTVQVGTHVAGDGAVLSLHWFEPRANHRFLMFERVVDGETTDLRYMQFPAGTSSSIATRRRISGQFNGRFLENGRWVYHLNGLEQPLRWDGRRQAPVGFVTPPGPPRVIGYDSGANRPDRAGITAWDTTYTRPQTTQIGVGEYPDGGASAYWRYGWAVSWVNDLGMESPRSSIAWASGANDTTNLRRCVRLQIDRPPSHIRAVILWRTRNTYEVRGTAIDSDAAMYKHSQWEVASEIDLWDNKPDAQLGILHNPDDTGAIPLNSAAATFWQGSMWLAVDGLLRHSSPLLFEQFPEVNTIPVGSRRSGRIVALLAVPRGLLVLKERGTFLVKGNPYDGYRVEEVSSTVGCAAPRTLVFLSDLGVATWLSDRGPEVLVGVLEDDQPTRVEPIRGIRKTWRREVWNLAGAWAVHDPEHEEVWFHLPVGGNLLPELGLVWHYKAGGWSTRRDDWPVGCATRYRGRMWLGSTDDSTNGKTGIHLLTFGAAQRFGSTCTGKYTTGWLATQERSSVHTVNLRAVGLGTPAVDVDYRGDRGPAFVSQAETARPTKHAEHERDLWGSGLWGSSYSWSDYEPVVIPISLHRAHAHEHQLRFRGSLIRLVGLDWGVDAAGGSNPVKRLERRV
jgi:hypothetical protein